MSGMVCKLGSISLLCLLKCCVLAIGFSKDLFKAIDPCSNKAEGE